MTNNASERNHIDLIKKRYFREIISNPDGEVVHDGDCSFFSVEVCDCGLLSMLRRYEDVWNYFPELVSQLLTHEKRINQLLNIENEDENIEEVTDEELENLFLSCGFLSEEDIKAINTDFDETDCIEDEQI